MAQAIAFIDDQYVPATEAKISILEPTFNKSDVVYDTLSSWKGLIFRLEEHLTRFENSFRAMELNPPYTTTRCGASSASASTARAMTTLASP